MLTEFFLEIQKENWPAKEREIISRFAFSKLVKNTDQCPKFYDPAQLGIEVRVKQIFGENKKEFVCKDLIIWKDPNSTAWTQNNLPIVIMEWKYNNKAPSEYDIDWLKNFTQENQSCIGIAVNIDNTPNYMLKALLIEKGSIKDMDWLQLNTT